VTGLFGSGRTWGVADPEHRRTGLVSLYRRQIIDTAGARHVRAFEMIDLRPYRSATDGVAGHAILGGDPPQAPDAGRDGEARAAPDRGEAPARQSDLFTFASEKIALKSSYFKTRTA
jgi:hypothetical protein